MPDDARLSTLLSQVLVAFAIEFDNEFEARLAKTWARPFRVSIVMWSNFMRFVREGGTPFEQLVTTTCIPQAAVASVVGGMERWRYVTVDHNPAEGTPPVRKGFGSARGIRSETMIYPSMSGQVAKDIWEPLNPEIEGRWKDRLGEGQIEDLRDALAAVENRIDLAMPHFLPVVGGNGLFADPLGQGAKAPDQQLPTLLSRVLLALTLDYEKESDVSLPVAANVLRVLDDSGVPVKDLPLATGVSKEAVSVSMNWLEKTGHTILEPDPASRGKIARRTAKGAEAHATHMRLLDQVETVWEKQFGDDSLGTLRSLLQFILDQPGGEKGPLSAGLVPPTGGWRGEGRYKKLTAAFIKSPRDALPHNPMVLHRGGWPDGS